LTLSTKFNHNQRQNVRGV